MFQRSDAGLVRNVYAQTYRDGFRIRANLTRFGGLAVFVYHDAHEGGTEAMWQGESILDARDMVDEWVAMHREDA